MDLSTKFRKVQAWLDQLFAGKPVPNFERNERIIGLLYDLMEKNAARDGDAQLITQDLRQKAVEYTAEGRRLGSILAALNLKSGNLSQSGVLSLRTLANLAWLLQIRDASDTSYLLAMLALQDQEDKVSEELDAEERLLAQLSRKTQDALVKHSSILKTSTDLEEWSTQQAGKKEKRKTETSFLHNKAQEYSKLSAKLKDKITKTGVDPSLYHDNLVKRAQDLQKLQKELEPLRKKLQDYHGLPPDISQAKLKVVELRKDLDNLENQLSIKIGDLKL